MPRKPTGYKGYRHELTGDPNIFFIWIHVGRYPKLVKYQMKVEHRKAEQTFILSAGERTMEMTYKEPPGRYGLFLAVTKKPASKHSKWDQEGGLIHLITLAIEEWMRR